MTDLDPVPALSFPSPPTISKTVSDEEKFKKMFCWDIQSPEMPIKMEKLIN